MSRKVSWSDLLRYQFENTLSAGPIAIIGWLAIVSILIVLVAATAVAAFGISFDPAEPDGANFIEASWALLMRTFDAGNMADDAGWSLRIITLLVTLGGIFIVSTLIGTITSGMEAQIEELRKGRSRVIESGHTLILGWSPSVFEIIGELVIANESQSRPRIVILAERDKVEMEDELRSKLPHTKNTRVICRTGSPLDLDDLELVNPHEAKSIIIVSPDVPNPDIYVIKSILALTNNPRRTDQPFHIVAEIRDPHNREAAELVGGDEAVLIFAADTIARITAQTCRQSGLSVVYQELMDFDGAEIYFTDASPLLGRSYRECLYCFEKSTVIGIFTQELEVLLNPPMNRSIEPGDRLIVIADDDSMIAITPRTMPQKTKAPVVRHPAPIAERTLVIGWNEKGERIIRELDAYVAAGSAVTILARGIDAQALTDRLQADQLRQAIEIVEGDTTDRATLEAIAPGAFNHLIVLSDTSRDVQEADANTLVTLLHLRKMSLHTNRRFSIVSEMLDVRNRALAEVAQPDDFIVSDKLISLMFSQISENRHLHKVFHELFRPEGSEIYLKPISNYVPAETSLDFYSLLAAAAERGETAIGYRIHSHANHSDHAYGVTINPTKSDARTFATEDRLIVLAED